MTDTVAKGPTAFGKGTPVLRVSNIAASADYYTRVLGFKLDFQFPDGADAIFASVTRGDTCLFLSVGDQGNFGSWVWIDGHNVEVVYAEFSASGAKIRNPPTNYQWALEMQVEDLDGNVLRIASDPRKDEPIGPWLDMYGKRWLPRPGGGWDEVK
jgi:catechol 2,3-dioxygenase-like lactoylglutathione lyase family enzyme